MAHIQNGKQKTDLKFGQNIFKNKIKRLVVSPYEKVTVYDGPNISDNKTNSVEFLAGNYKNLWVNARWLDNDKSKLIILSNTSFAPRELLTVLWSERDRKGKFYGASLKFEPGEYDVKHRNFRNDVIEQVIVPNNATATLFDGSNQTSGHVSLSKGQFSLRDYDLFRKISSFNYELDEWTKISDRLGKVLSKQNIGEPIIASFKGRGAPGSEVECPVSLSNTKTAEEEWHASASITESVTVKIGGEGAPVSAEFGLESTQEAGGSNTKGNESSQDAGIVVHAIADENGLVSGNIIAQRLMTKNKIFRVLRNERTGEEKEQEGILSAQKYDFSFDFEYGKDVNNYEE